MEGEKRLRARARNRIINSGMNLELQVLQVNRNYKCNIVHMIYDSNKKFKSNSKFKSERDMRLVSNNNHYYCPKRETCINSRCLNLASVEIFRFKFRVEGFSGIPTNIM